MNQATFNSNPIPKLDLAPKLKRPFSIWNPFDYLLILYWIFFFPQALRWYQTKYGGHQKEYQFNGLNNIPQLWNYILEQWSLLFKNPQLLKLWIQGIILIIITPYLFALILDYLPYVDVDWSIATQVTTLDMVFSAIYVIAGSIVGNMIIGIGVTIVQNLSSIITYATEINLDMPLLLVILKGAVLGLTFGTIYSIVSTKNMVVYNLMIFIVLFGEITSSTLSSITTGQIGESVRCISLIIVVLRVGDYLWGTFLNHYFFPNNILPSRLTPIPVEGLKRSLQSWLKQDWQKGIYNVNQLLDYSFQFIPVVNAINSVLAQTTEQQIIERISYLSEKTNRWDLVYYCCVSSTYSLSFYFDSYSSLLPLDTPARSTSAGFWYLYLKQPVKASTAFKTVRHLNHGEEMYVLASILHRFNLIRHIDSMLKLEKPTLPSPPYLYPNTWQTIEKLYTIVENKEHLASLQAHQNYFRQMSKELAEIIRINEDVSHPQRLANPQRQLIVQIVQTWLKAIAIAKILDNVNQ